MVTSEQDIQYITNMQQCCSGSWNQEPSQFHWELYQAWLVTSRTGPDGYIKNQIGPQELGCNIGRVCFTPQQALPNFGVPILWRRNRPLSWCHLADALAKIALRMGGLGWASQIIGVQPMAADGSRSGQLLVRLALAANQMYPQAITMVMSGNNQNELAIGQQVLVVWHYGKSCLSSIHVHRK